MLGYLVAVLHSAPSDWKRTSWCRGPWRHGSCGIPAAKSSASTPCRADHIGGTWRHVADAAACAQLCRGCGRCKHISYSPLDSECSWFARCGTLLQIKGHGSRGKRVVVNQSRSKPITDRRHCTLAAADLDTAYPATWPASQELLLARGVVSMGSRQNAEALLRMARGAGQSGSSQTTSVLGIGSSVTQHSGGGPNLFLGSTCRSSKCREDGFLMQAANAIKAIGVDAIKATSAPGGTPQQASGITVYNAGRQGGSMDHFADCYTTYMPPAVHLVIIELTITPSPLASPLERLIRLLLSAPEPPTVVLLRPIHTWWRDNAQAGVCNHALLRSLAAHYGVAYVDEFSILTHSENASDAYTFANLADKSGDLHPAALLLDTVHPIARGARLLGSALERALRSMLSAAEDGSLPSLASLPMPLSGGGGGSKYSHQCYEFRGPLGVGVGVGVGAANATADAPRAETSHKKWSLLKRIATHKGPSAAEQLRSTAAARPTVPISSDPYSRWEYVHDTSKFGAQRYGLASTVPGSHVTFAPLDTRPHNNAKATPIVQVEYLSSYDRQMGAAQLECLSGCTCRTTLLQGRATSRISVPVATAVAVSASARCVMRVTLLGSTNSGGGRASTDGVQHGMSKRATTGASRFKLTGLRIGAEEAEEVTEVGGRRATPAALQTLQRDLLGCDPVKSLQSKFLARRV